MTGESSQKAERHEMYATGIKALVFAAGIPVFAATPTKIGIGMIAAANFLVSLPLTTICVGIGLAAIALNAYKDHVPAKVELKEADVKGWRVFLGRTTWYRPVYHDFDAIPHTKVGGVTGAGKTKGLELILGQIIRTKMEDEVEIHIIDMKDGASFSHFSRLPQVNHRIYAGVNQALVALQGIHTVMAERLAAIRERRSKFESIPRFKRILVVIDEGGELSPTYAHSEADKKLRQECLGYLSSIARVGREPRVSIVYGTQRPSNETLPVGIRGQMDATLAYRTQNDKDSEILLRNPDAAELKNVKGRMIYQTPNGMKLVQTAYIPDDTLQRWIEEQISYQDITTPPINPPSTDKEVSTGDPDHGLDNVVYVSDWGR